MSDPAPPPPVPGDARRQLAASYAATGAKVLAWAVVAAIVYREGGAPAFALLILLRGTLGILNYTSLGLGPAVLRLLTIADREAATPRPAPAEGAVAEETAATEREGGPRPLEYAGAGPSLVAAPATSSSYELITAAILVTAALAVPALALLVVLGAAFDTLFDIPLVPPKLEVDLLVWMFGLGVLVRLAGDVAGAVTQARGRIAPDHLRVTGGEVLWVVLFVVFWARYPGGRLLEAMAATYLLSGLVACGLRVASVLQAPEGRPGERRLPAGVWLASKSLLAYGGLVTLGSIADFLYAPIDYIILNRLVDPLAVAVYGPAVQIDAALILLVMAIANVILPRSAMRHAAGDAAGVWREYVRASLAAAGITLVAAVGVWLASPWLFTLWLGDPLPATQAILPLVLAHTVMGAATGVGRATLLAIGRAGAYAASVLVGGLVNVALSLLLVWAGLGLWGVIWGTVISVTVRCAVWMPWYIRRCVRL